MKSKIVLLAAGAAAAASPAFAGGGGITIPDFGVDGASLVGALTTSVSPGVTAAVGLGMGLFGIYLVIRTIRRFARP